MGNRGFQEEMWALVPSAGTWLVLPSFPCFSYLPYDTCTTWKENRCWDCSGLLISHITSYPMCNHGHDPTASLAWCGTLPSRWHGTLPAKKTWGSFGDIPGWEMSKGGAQLHHISLRQALPRNICTLASVLRAFALKCLSTDLHPTLFMLLLCLCLCISCFHVHAFYYLSMQAHLEGGLGLAQF